MLVSLELAVVYTDVSLLRYMSTSAEAIGINAQFLYAPDCMLISFLVSHHLPSKLPVSSQPKKASYRNTLSVGEQRLTDFSITAGQEYSNHQNDNGHGSTRDRPWTDE